MSISALHTTPRKSRWTLAASMFVAGAFLTNLDLGVTIVVILAVASLVYKFITSLVGLGRRGNPSGAGADAGLALLPDEVQVNLLLDDVTVNPGSGLLMQESGGIDSSGYSNGSGPGFDSHI
ncbi:MAG TPA: hypothetical protein VES73_16705 [Lamprocystis sp. (in: g-proteobacteria)]|nr:hypothetical protein [Lamprocystis sp. (in: g-proteobacteria)]